MFVFARCILGLMLLFVLCGRGTAQSFGTGVLFDDAAYESEWSMARGMDFTDLDTLKAISLKEYAKDAGVTDKNFLTKLVDSVYGWSVRADLLEGADMGIRDVPFFYINGEEYKGGVNTSAMSKVIDGFLKKKVAVKTSSKAAAKKRA